MTKWQVICDPVEGNTTGTDNKNEGGLIVKLVKLTINDDGETERTEVEHSRVGFARKNTKYPKKKFDVALKGEIESAQHAAEVANELEAKLASAQAVADAARKHMDEIREELNSAGDKADAAERELDGALDEARSTAPAGELA